MPVLVYRCPTIALSVAYVPPNWTLDATAVTISNPAALSLVGFYNYPKQLDSLYILRSPDP